MADVALCMQVYNIMWQLWRSKNQEKYIGHVI